jgi:hypothetical protein
MAVGIQIEQLDRDAAGTITVRTYDGHGFSVGDKVRFFNVMGGGTYPFMAKNPYTVTRTGTAIMDGRIVVRPSVTFDVVQAGATEAASVQGTIAITAGTPYQNSNQFYLITTASPHGFTYQPELKIKGVTSSAISPLLLSFINAGFNQGEIQVVNTTQFIVKIPRQLIGNPAITWTTGSVVLWPTGLTVAFDDGIRGIGSIGGLTLTSINSKIRARGEAWVVGSMLTLAGNSKGIDYPFLRLFNPMDVSRIARLRQKLLRTKIVTQAQTLRSAMDLVVENFQQTDLKQRRFYINQDGQFVYENKDDAQPATATAPYKIVTASAGSPNISNAAASVAPSSLQVSLDHDGAKRALFRGPTNEEGPVADLIKFDSPDAMGTAYTRVGAPYFDEIVDYPDGTGVNKIRRQQAANSFFLERSLPVPSISFTLRGSGTASWNNLGFTSGYAQITPTTSISVDINTIAAVSGTVTVTTWPLDNGVVVGSQVVVENVKPAATYSGTFTVTGTARVPYPFTFSYLSGTSSASADFRDDAVITVFGKYERTGTAPNQIVTVSLPNPHGLSTGASVTVTGLTGTAGTSMNTTATMTRVDDYTFTYPSTGTNGTATGAGTISAITLVSRWQPGQWVDITAAELGLSGLYRIEQVDWGFEPGSFNQYVTVTCQRRNPKKITKLMSKEFGR